MKGAQINAMIPTGVPRIVPAALPILFHVHPPHASRCRVTPSLRTGDR
ncbi:MAG: hypothetical protein QF467_02150 [SAR202 cluster bacterium]|nr:hypothetical protein [SAR202 cluster bacterium]